MGRAAWWITVHGVAESDMTEVTYHEPVKNIEKAWSDRWKQSEFC